MGARGVPSIWRLSQHCTEEEKINSTHSVPAHLELEEQIDRLPIPVELVIDMIYMMALKRRSCCSVYVSFRQLLAALSCRLRVGKARSFSLDDPKASSREL